MCGICGFYNTRGPADRRTLKRMNDQIIHRGPDDEGYFLKGPVGLSARRLSIIDLVTGHQPQSSESRTATITFNGEIYNYRELKQQLSARGMRFRTASDTEVVINLYQAYGKDFVHRLNGMFALGIYDEKTRSLVLARDRLGIKPLYYYLHPDHKSLVFASEIKSILQYPGIPREIDPVALDYFLTLEYIPAPFSLFKGIFKLPAGHLLIYKDRQIRTEEYWDVRPGTRTGNLTRLQDEFRHLLRDAVTRRMISDVPLGAFLSGGIDSSTIVSQMCHQSPKKIKTFSIGFEEKSYSELTYSNMVADLLGTQHTIRELKPDINHLVMQLAEYFDEPLGDFSNFPTYLVSRTAREQVTVVLSGDGGDEIFGGYEHYIAQKISRILDVAPFRPFHPLMARFTHLFPPSRKKKGWVNRIKRFSEGLNHPCSLRHFRWMLFLTSRDKKKLYSPAFLQEYFLDPLNQRNPFDKHFHRASHFPGINQDLYLDLKTYLADNILVKVDRTSMANSLEARVPLLDHRLVEFAFSLPPDYKVRGHTTKWFFKEAMKDTLPPQIIHRRKEGFSIPIKNWLKTDLKDLMMEYLSPARIKDLGYFHSPRIQHMIREHLQNRQNHSHRLWSLILFNLWREKFQKV